MIIAMEDYEKACGVRACGSEVNQITRNSSRGRCKGALGVPLRWLKCRENPNLGARALQRAYSQTKARKALVGHLCIGCSLCAPRVFTLGLTRSLVGTRINQKGSTHSTNKSRIVRNSVLTSNYYSTRPEIKCNNCYNYVLSCRVCLTLGR